MTLVEGFDDAVLAIVAGLFGVAATVVFGAAFRWRRMRMRMRMRMPPPEAAAAAAHPFRERRIDGDDDECPICFDAMRHAVALEPCGHVFCGRCVLAFWATTGRARPIRCPIDRTESIALRRRQMPAADAAAAADADDDEEGREVAAGVARYNEAFDGRTLRSFLFRGWRRFWAGISEPGALSLLHYTYLVLSMFIAVCYLLLPFDLIPEGAMGAFYVLGLIDDLLIALLATAIVGNVIRVVGD